MGAYDSDWFSVMGYLALACYTNGNVHPWGFSRTFIGALSGESPSFDDKPSGSGSFAMGHVVIQALNAFRLLGSRKTFSSRLMFFVTYAFISPCTNSLTLSISAFSKIGICVYATGVVSVCDDDTPTMMAT